MSNVADLPRDRRPPARNDLRVPPHNIDAEASLLGAMLLSADAAGLAVEEQLMPDDFYKPAHVTIFEAIRSLISGGEAIDPVTVGEELRRNKVLDDTGGLDYLVELQNSTPSVSSASRYIKIVKDTALLRRLIFTASEIADLAYSEPDDVTQALNLAEKKVFDIAEEEVTNTLYHLNELTGDAINIIQERYDSKSEITGVPTGYYDLDRLLSGLQPGTLNIVGARPAMGKSAFALGMAVNVARRTNRPVLFFSLEMSAVELTQRIISAEAQVQSESLRSGKLTERDWSSVANSVGRLNIPLYIDDTSQITVMQIHQKIRRITQRDDKPALVVIDYLQLMGSDKGTRSVENRQIEVSEISRGLKLLAREFNVPVVALSQLSRGVEQRTDKRPVLADLRESGALEQDADVVMFLYRNENPDDPNEHGYADVLVQKHRSGPTGSVKLLFIGQFTQFQNLAK